MSQRSDIRGSRAKRIILFGTWAEENLGDDLLLRVQIDCIREIYPNAEFVIFTGKCDVTCALLESEGVMGDHIRLVYTGRWGLREPGKSFFSSLSWFFSNLYEIFRSDLLLIGPGNQIQDVTRKYRVLFFISRALLAWMFRTPFAYFGIGFFSLKNRFCRWLLRFTANRSVFVSTRDMGSADDFRALGVREDLIHGLTDISFAYQWPVPAVRKNDSDRPIVGLTSRIFLPEFYASEVIASFEACYGALLKRIYQETGACFRFFPFYRGSQWHDGVALGRLMKQIADPEFPIETIPFRNLHKTQDDMLDCDIFIGVRYHSVLISVQNNIPVLAIGYGKKTWRFMSENGLSDYCLRVEDVSGNGLQKRWDELWQNRNTFQRLACKAKVEATRKAQVQIDLIRQVLDGQ